MASNATQLRELGSSGVRCSQLGFGGAPIGDLFEKLPSSQALAAVTKAHELGICYFDTAPWYGLGLSEVRTGLALNAVPRDTYQISTKIGRYLQPHADSGTWSSIDFVHGLQNSIEFAYGYHDVMRQYEDSLQRLGSGRVEALVIHDMEEAEGQVPTHARGTRKNLAGEGVDLGGWKALLELREAGRIKAIGASINLAAGTPNHTKDSFRKWNIDYVDFLLGLPCDGKRTIDFLLVAGMHNLLDHTVWADGILQKCSEKGIRVVLGGAFATGILATGSIEGAKYNYDVAPPEILGRVRRLERICGDFGVPLAAVALQFPLGHRVVCTVIAGCKSPEEVERAVKTMNVEIPNDLWTRLKTEGLLPQGLPTPDSSNQAYDPAAKRARLST